MPRSSLPATQPVFSGDGEPQSPAGGQTPAPTAPLHNHHNPKTQSNTSIPSGQATLDMGLPLRPMVLTPRSISLPHLHCWEGKTQDPRSVCAQPSKTRSLLCLSEPHRSPTRDSCLGSVWIPLWSWNGKEQRLICIG